MCQEKGLSGDVSLGMLSAQVVLKTMMWGIIPQAMKRQGGERPRASSGCSNTEREFKARLTWSPVQHCRGSDLTRCRGPGRDAVLPF